MMQICFIYTEWGEIKSIRPEDYKKLMRRPLVYYGRNIYGVNYMKAAGVEYYSVGRTYGDRKVIHRKDKGDELNWLKNLKH